MPKVGEDDLWIEDLAYRLLDTLGPVLLYTVPVSIAFVALFVLHQMFVWLSTDPETAFHLAKGLTSSISTVWNTVRSLGNAVLDVVTTAIPAWNVGVKHVIEPIVYTTLEVVSLVFTHHSYNGIISEDSVPFEGHLCDGSQENAEWCASSARFAENLGVVEGSASNVINNGTTLMLSTASARRLQVMADTAGAFDAGQSLVGELPIQPLIDAVHEIAGVIVLVLAQVADVAMHVIYTVLSEVAVLIWNIAQTLIKALASLAMQVVSSGILQSLLKVGLDVLVVLVMHVAVPLLFAIMNVFTCLVNFMQPGTWPDQLSCVERVCFAENGNIGTHTHAHTHTHTHLTARSPTL